MENFAKPSVLKNHKNSFFSSVKSIRELIDGLSNDYSQVSDRLSKFSQKRKELIQSLESKFKTYNFKFKEPLISNDLDTIVKYVDELQSELAISLASMEESKKDKVLDDSLLISSEITQIKMISSYIDKESNNLLSFEDELSKIRIPEKDSKEETIINFKDLSKNKKKNEEKIVTTDVSDNIDSAIFNEENDDQKELESYIDDLLTEENSVPVKMNPGFSFVDRVEAVYGDKEYWDEVYKFNSSNKNKIDSKADELGMTPEDVCFDSDALSGVIIDFPTELSVEEEKEDVKRLG